MKQQIGFTFIDPNKYRIYTDALTKNFLVVTPEEADRIQRVIAREYSQGTQHKDIDPAAIAEGIKLTYNALTNTYVIADASLISYSICTLEYHEPVLAYQAL